MQTLEQAQESVKDIINNYRNHPTCTPLYWEDTYQTIQKITPLEASEILKHHHIKINRKERKGASQLIAFEINQERWIPVVSSIKFSTEGKLIDGQHRLSAISQQEKTIQIIVQHNLPSRTIHFVDKNVKRTAADIFMFSGQFKNKNLAQHSSQLCSILVFLQEKGYHVSSLRKNQTSVRQNCLANLNTKSSDKAGVMGKSFSEYLNYYKKHKAEVDESIRWVNSEVKNRQKLMDKSRIFCAYHLFRFIDKIAAREYIKNIFNQEGLIQGTTEYRVYDILLAGLSDAESCKLSAREKEETLYNGFLFSCVKKEKKRVKGVKFKETAEIKELLKNGNHEKIKSLPSREIYTMFKEKYDERSSLDLDAMFDYYKPNA